MNPEFVCIIRFDFCIKSNNKNLHEKLEEIYEKQEEIINAEGIGTGMNQSHFNVYKDNNFSKFKYFATMVTNEINFITDVITVAILSEDQIQKIVEDEVDLEFYQDKVDEIQEKLPVYTKQSYNDSTVSPTITFIRPESPHNIFDENNEVDIDKAKEFINKNCNLLNKFNFHTHSIISLIHGDEKFPWENFITFQNNRWGPLTILNTGHFHKFYIDIERSSFLLELIKDFSLMRSLFRGYYWLIYRENEISIIDERTYKLLSESFNNKNWNDFIKLNKKQEKLKSDWIKLSRKTIDEIYELNKVTPFFDENNEEYISHKFDIPIDFEHGLNLIGNPDSVIYLYMRDIKFLYNKTIGDLERVKEKQRQISNTFHDEMNVRSIKTSTKHTKWMTYMTIIILLSTIISLIITVNSEIGVSYIINSILDFIKFYHKRFLVY